MDLVIIMVSEGSQKKTDKYNKTSLIWNLNKYTNELIY